MGIVFRKSSLTFHGTSEDQLCAKNYPLTIPKEKIAWLTTKNFDCLQKINFAFHLHMGIHTALYNQLFKNSFHFLSRKVNRPMHKNFIPLLIQRKNRAPLCAGKQKKTYTSTHNETRGAVSIPIGSYCACMYKSSNYPFCISIFRPRPRGCSILTQSFLFVQSE